jgi:hypothetical protein
MGERRFEQGLVRALLKDQHPDLADLELRDVNGGWDNQQWRLGDELAVRLPRTERAPPGSCCLWVRRVGSSTPTGGSTTRPSLGPVAGRSCVLSG